MIKMLLTMVTVFAVMSVNASTDNKSDIEKRIKPVGSVYIAGAEPVVAESTGPRSGEQVYQSACVACHGAGIMGAPKVGDAGAWSARVAQGMDVLTEHAINGFNAMPAKGGCVACSDEEIKLAITYMVDGSK